MASSPLSRALAALADAQQRAPRLTALAGGLAVAALIYRSTASSADPLPTDGHDVPLLDLESTALMMMTPAVTSVDFFEGDPAAAAEHLRSAVSAVLAANPWLGGTLTRNARTGLVHLRWGGTSSKGVLPSAHYAEAEDSAAAASDAGAPYDAVARALGRFSVPVCSACVDASPPPPLFRVTLVRAPQAPSSFAVVVSLSHVVGDGSTFYALRDALRAGGGPPRAFDVHRRHTFSQELKGLLGGGNDTLTWFTSVGCTAGIIRNLVFGARPRILMAPVDPGWLASEKSRAGGPDGSFVSSNDVVTSALLAAFRCDVGVMAVNFRGRLAGLGPAHAGNYEALTAYNTADYATPALIRASLLVGGGGVRRAGGDTPLPGALHTALTARTALVSSWATFFTQLDLPGAATLRHAPVVDTATVPLTDIAIVFRPSPGQLAVLALTRSLTGAQLVGALGGKGAGV